MKFWHHLQSGGVLVWNGAYFCRLFSTKQLSDMKSSGSFFPHADGALTNNNLNFGASLPVYLRTECKAHPYVKDLL